MEGGGNLSQANQAASSGDGDTSQINQGNVQGGGTISQSNQSSSSSSGNTSQSNQASISGGGGGRGAAIQQGNQATVEAPRPQACTGEPRSLCNYLVNRGVDVLLWPEDCCRRQYCRDAGQTEGRGRCPRRCGQCAP